MAKRKAVKKVAVKTKPVTSTQKLNVPMAWTVTYDRQSPEKDAKEKREKDASIAHVVHQFAAACAVLMDRTGPQCKQDLWDALEAVLNDAAKQFSFRSGKN